tara:strand:+ start:2458 stop:2880 length:423 start_codon:yes stop_codon:yes gene_type:complete
MFQRTIREKLERLEIDISNLELIDMDNQSPWMIEIHNTTKKITKRLKLALSYLHNGNEKKYAEYRDKVKSSMSDELTLVMDLDEKIDIYRQDDSPAGDMIISDKRLGSEGYALQHAEGMKFWNDAFKNFEESATYIGHWK